MNYILEIECIKSDNLLDKWIDGFLQYFWFGKENGNPENDILVTINLN